MAQIIDGKAISAGAGFVVVLTGNVMTMPGLSKKPAAYEINLTDDGKIQGLFQNYSRVAQVYRIVCGTNKKMYVLKILRINNIIRKCLEAVGS